VVLTHPAPKTPSDHRSFRVIKMNSYVGILDGEGSIWGVRFPDIPGCVGGGSSPEEAITDATIALRDVIAFKSGGGFAVPAPTPLAKVLASGEVEKGESVVLIPLVVDAGRTVRANLTLDAGLLEAIDVAAKLAGITRSAFVASATREKLMRV
jgi:predicted RNase H-like HicB family nuclease